jgi:hypothetical protein
MAQTTTSPAGDFWAITTYFNPARYRRRLSNFKIFRKYLNVPLLAVEWSYSDDFELQDHDADILVRLHGGAVLWQKERLLNLALKALPNSCHKVAWLDCDIIFQQDNWAQSASMLLDRVSLVQLFKCVHHLQEHWRPGFPTTDVERSRPSVAYMVSSGMSAVNSFTKAAQSDDEVPSRGFAWAAHRELLDRHGFYDACIIGSGDGAPVSAGYGCVDAFMDRQYMNEPQRRRFLAWAEPFRETVKAEIAVLETDILHLWHGSRADRAYVARHEGMQQFGFDPFKDIVIEENGSWGWNTDKPDMHDYVRNYFLSRREDG